jgi:hypothetical protein
MSHFAKINISNIVTELIVSEQDFINSGKVGDSFLWVQTSYNNSFRKNFAKIGDTWDANKNAFISPQPNPAGTSKETTCQWEAPSAAPTKAHSWNETDKKWE